MPAALIMIGATPSYADHGKKVDMKFVGTLLDGIEQRLRNDPTDPTDDTVELITLVETTAIGTLGRARIQVVSKTEDVLPAPDPVCPMGFLKVATITDNNIVLTFGSLTLLHGDGNGTVCINFDTGEQFASIDGVWTGGTRRFANAEGDFHITIDKIVPLSSSFPFSSTQFSVEEGRIKGRVR